jgi:hypothetical protein
MTEAAFRSNDGYVDRMREIFADPVYQAFLIMLKDSAPIEDALDSDPEIVSVRRLSKLAGYDECLSRHFAASIPLLKPPERIPETWAPEEPQPV